jgi:hypothetical protein
LKRLHEFLRDLEPRVKGIRARKADIRVNPPLLAIRDRGNGYVLRKRIPAIHWGEAVEQIQVNPALKMMNDSMRIDRIIRSTVKTAFEILPDGLDEQNADMKDLTTPFVSWDLKTNRPKLVVDFTGTSLESVWMA